MKEALKNICRTLQDSSQAETALSYWCNAILQTSVLELHRIDKTFVASLEENPGILEICRNDQRCYGRF